MLGHRFYLLITQQAPEPGFFVYARNEDDVADQQLHLNFRRNNTHHGALVGCEISTLQAAEPSGAALQRIPAALDRR